MGGELVRERSELVSKGMRERESEVCLIINGYGYMVGGTHRHNSAQKVNSEP